MKAKLIATSILLSLSFVACATPDAPVVSTDATPKSYFPQDTTCPRGQAQTYTLQCDPGMRPPIERIWNPQGPGYEVCRVSRWSCQPINDGQFNENSRPGHEVLDSGGGGIAIVDFGVGRVMGLEPF
jgi:hypothetical protein